MSGKSRIFAFSIVEPMTRNDMNNTEQGRRVKVGIAQLACSADKEANIERYTVKVRELAAQGAQIVCLQELFASLYFCDEERYQDRKSVV